MLLLQFCCTEGAKFIFSKLDQISFSGKMFGIHANYIIAEVEFFEGEDPEEPQDDEKQQEEEVLFYCFTF